MSSVGTQGRGGTRRATKSRTPGGTLLVLISHTVGMQSRSVLIWGVVLGLYSAAMTASFTTFSGNAEQMNQLLEAYPQGLAEAFGIQDLSDVENYLNSQIFLLAPLALSFFPMLAAAGTVAGAEERGTIDILLGNPIRRWQLVAGSFAATAFSLLSIVAVMGLLTWGTAVLIDVDLSFRSTAAAVLNLWPVCLLFGGLAMLCSAIVRRKSLAVAIPAFLMFASYLADTIGRASENLEGLRPASVFYYYGSAIEDGIEWANFAGLTAAAVASVVLAMLAFQRRDIYT
ncbi:MAG: ABC transporter permease subunit [Rubrobacter sp.]